MRGWFYISENLKYFLCFILILVGFSLLARLRRLKRKGSTTSRRNQARPFRNSDDTYSSPDVDGQGNEEFSDNNRDDTSESDDSCDDSDSGDSYDDGGSDDSDSGSDSD